MNAFWTRTQITHLQGDVEGLDHCQCIYMYLLTGGVPFLLVRALGIALNLSEAERSGHYNQIHI